MPSSSFFGTGLTKRILRRNEASGVASVTASVFGSTTLMPATSCAVPAMYSFAPWIEASFDARGAGSRLGEDTLHREGDIVRRQIACRRENLALSCRVKVKVWPSIFHDFARPGFGTKVSGLRRHQLIEEHLDAPVALGLARRRRG